ncbi:MAG: HDOD domain-containing protein, partial [Planctomycetota bacterium]
MAERSSTGGAPESALAHLDALPTLAPVAVRLLHVATSADAGASDLSRLLYGDQTLASRVLAIANSSAMGLREEVRTLDRAVVLLGFNQIRNVVLAVKVLDCFDRPGPDEDERRRRRAEFWTHSLGVACAARRLARARAKLGIDPEEAFLAGLLHDLGKVALDCVFPKAYSRAVAQAELARGDIADHERALLGVDHTAAGRRLAERWKLPAYLRNVIWLHHIAVEALPTRVETPELLALVQLADTLVREQRIGGSGNYAFYESSSRLARHLSIPETVLQSVAPTIAADVAEHVGWLGLDQQTPEALYLQALTRANSELSRLNTQLVTANRELAAAARYFRALTRFDKRLTADAQF